MESITILPKNEKQFSVIKAFLKEMKIKFTTEKDETLMSEKEFYDKIDEAIKEVEEGKGTLVKTKKELHDYLDSL